MGHLKAACPKLAATYPFESSVDVCSSTVCMYESVGVYNAKGEPDGVSSLKRGDYAQPKDVDLHDIKTAEPTVCLSPQCLPKVQQGSSESFDIKFLRSSVDNARGEPDCVSSLKRGDYAQPKGVDLLDIKTAEPTVCLSQQCLQKVQQGSPKSFDNKFLRPRVACKNSANPPYSESPSFPSVGETAGLQFKDDADYVLDDPSSGVSAGTSGSTFDLGNSGDDVFQEGRFWEVEAGGSQITDVQRRLKKCVEQELTPAPWIVDCIKTGYKLPLKTTPDAYCRPNQKSALQNKEFVSQALVELELNRCIEHVPQKPHICSPLSVVSNSSGKQRLVINLRYLNQFLWKDKFKYEDMRIAMLMFQKGDYLFLFDLKSGYHHVDIYKPHQCYLGFQWESEGATQFYVFKVLPFGLATACYAFTKLLRPLVKYWRGQGLRVVLYLDDGIVAVDGESAATRASAKVRSDLVRAGLVEHTAKCNWTPSQQVTWLGFDLDLEAGLVSIPGEKIVALKTQLQQVCAHTSVMARTLASVIGKIMSMSLAIGPVSRLMTRSLYTVLNVRDFWCQFLPISIEARYELEFWLNQIDNLNGQGIWHSPSAVRVVYTDASNSGYAGYTVEHGYHIAHRLWSEEEAALSSTWRELRAVRLVLESLVGKLRGHRLRWFTDNQNVVRIISTGSKKPSLQKEALAIYSFAISNGVHIEPEWIPRDENQKADLLSKQPDQDDWSIHPNVFKDLDEAWGPHTIDRFANYCNTQLTRFNSRFWNPGTEAVDTFTCNWEGEMNWLCPPPHLIPRTIQHAKRTHACGTLIVPEWPSAPFWPMIFPNGQQPAPFIVAMVLLPKSASLICPGRAGSSLFKREPNANLLALLLNCN